MIADAMRDCSKRGGLVLDPFAGSGTVLIAAERTGRHARAIEFEPRYVDVGIKRWERVTGELAVHEASGATYEELKDSPSSNCDSMQSARLAVAIIISRHANRFHFLLMFQNDTV